MGSYPTPLRRLMGHLRGPEGFDGTLVPLISHPCEEGTGQFTSKQRHEQLLNINLYILLFQ